MPGALSQQQSADKEMRPPPTLQADNKVLFSRVCSWHNSREGRQGSSTLFLAGLAVVSMEGLYYSGTGRI